MLLIGGADLDPSVFFRFVGMVTAAGTLGLITHFLTRKGP